MQIPKTTAKTRKKRLKYCQYHGCDKEFMGIPVQKYCNFHTNARNRKRVKPKREDPDLRNRVFAHKFSKTTLIQFVCALKGCTDTFWVKVLPRQFIYPRYCEVHRSEFKRELFLRTHSAGRKISTLQNSSTSTPKPRRNRTALELL